MSKRTDSALYPPLAAFCQEAEKQFDQIPRSRKEELRRLSDYITEKTNKGLRAAITVICTHNSRRSHFGQLGLALAADYYGVSGIDTYSGGTEATALHPNAVAALERAGFVVEREGVKENNPVYHIQWYEGQIPYRAFSKRFDDPVNPQTGFAAILVCTEAEAGCPVVSGSDLRLPLPYEDPKVFDGTPKVAMMYTERLQQIFREMLYAMKLSQR